MPNIISPWINKDTRTFMSRGYLAEGQSIEERIKVVGDAAEKILNMPGFSEKVQEYLLRGYFSLSTPIWANFGNARGLPISCNGSFVDDSVESILEKLAEIGQMSKNAAGTSAYFGAIRPRGTPISTGGLADGPVFYMDMYETLVNTISQSSMRRGSIAAYMSITHPDIKEFLKLRSEGHSIQKMSIGVTIPDDWMEAMVNGDRDKRKLWAAIIEKRFESGYPYIVFSDTANREKPQWYRDANMTIWASNLCTEIFLPSSPSESFVCNLLSMNALLYDEWKNTDAVEVGIYLLDAVMTEYIDKTKDIKFMEAARNFAINHRALGMGVLGWHSLLQSKMLPFRSSEAKALNDELFKFIRDRADEATRKLAVIFGEAPVARGHGVRNSTVMAIAPTTSSAFILGQVSPSVEPENSNYYIKDLAKGKFTYKNPYLKKLLAEKGLDTPEVWKDILLHGGSVQHMDELTAREKAVFETFGEIPQFEIIAQAALRQQYIDQGQSINLMIHPEADLKSVNALYIEAWRLGLKSLYYQRSTNPAQEYARNLLACVSCEA